MLYFWHNAQISGEIHRQFDEARNGGGVSNKNTINFRKPLSDSCTAEKAVLR